MVSSVGIKILNSFPTQIIIGFLLISILFSAISTNFQPLFGQVNSEKGQSRKICSEVYNASARNANNTYNAAKDALGSLTFDQFGAALSQATRAYEALITHNHVIYNECLRAEFYSVKGSTLWELADRFKTWKDDQDGTEANAVTTYSITYQLMLDKDGLVDGSSTIEVDKIIKMPSCDSGCTLSLAAQNEWVRYIGAILEHENGHVDRINQYFDGILDKVVEKNPDEAEQVIQDVEKALLGEQHKYDKETRHGETQGYILDFSIN